MPKKNDILTLKIEDLTNLGFGVAKCDGMVVFVQDAVPGDTVRARVIKATASYCVARLDGLLAPEIVRYMPSNCISSFWDRSS